MRLRRCAHVMLEPRERTAFELDSLLDGGDGLARTLHWIAHAPHLDGEVELDADEVLALGRFAPGGWLDVDALDGATRALVEKGLLIVEDGGHAARDAALRARHWRTVSAVAHYASRWHDVDADENRRKPGFSNMRELLATLGDAPSHVREHAKKRERIALRVPKESPLDALMRRRTTCRNFDTRKRLKRDELDAVLRRAFGALHVHEIAAGQSVLKKNTPSGGGLHALECYAIVRRVEGIAPGLYHYHPVAHALEPMKALDARAAAKLALTVVAGQKYFADAPVLLPIAARFERSFWKYRDHAKAYRSLLLETGHASQTLYLAATELGLGAYVTAAINETDIENAFGLDPIETGVIALCGFGARAAQRATVEFDPLRAVWRD